MIKIWKQCCVIALTLLLSTVQAYAAEFPGRDLYPDVPVIELDDLYNKLDQVVVVDVRSQYEYDTLSVKGARNIPIAGTDFQDSLEALRAETGKPIVFYCNGKTCHKSYQAVRKAHLAKIENCYAFDAGIFDWAKAHPDQAMLLGKTPINPNDLIDDEGFAAHLLDPQAFGAKVTEGGIVLDVRDRFQRAGVGLFAFKEQRVGLDETDKLDHYIAQAKRENKPLLIYDEVGKQVRWFQYYLEEQGLKNYYFMKGGAVAFYKMLEKDTLGR